MVKTKGTQMKILESIKHISIGIIILIAVILAVLTGCATTTKREAVYIPTKCKTKPIPKPIPSKESSVSVEVAEILKYTEILERDLEFCRGE